MLHALVLALALALALTPTLILVPTLALALPLAPVLPPLAQVLSLALVLSLAAALARVLLLALHEAAMALKRAENLPIQRRVYLRKSGMPLLTQSTTTPLDCRKKYHMLSSWHHNNT